MRVVSLLVIALLAGSTAMDAQVANRSQIGAHMRAVPVAAPAADVSVDVFVGTLGIGAQVAKLVTPHLALRAGGTYFTLSKTTNQSDVKYDATLNLKSFMGVLDFFPSARGAFRLTGGVIGNKSTVDATGVCTGTLDLNDRTYTCAQVGTLTGSVEFPSASPYVGLGFGTPARGSRVHFVMDLGGAFGGPTLVLNASNAGSNPQLAADVKAQRDKTQDDIDKYAKVYPVINIGFGVRF
jgi:hypothetical protein